MKYQVLTRWGDRAVFFAIIGAILISFIASITFIAILYFQINDFYFQIAVCAMNKNSQCLINILGDRVLADINIVTILSSLASINGIIASMTFLILYKLR